MRSRRLNNFHDDKIHFHYTSFQRAEIFVSVDFLHQFSLGSRGKDFTVKLCFFELDIGSDFKELRNLCTNNYR